MTMPSNIYLRPWASVLSVFLAACGSSPTPLKVTPKPPASANVVVPEAPKLAEPAPVPESPAVAAPENVVMTPTIATKELQVVQSIDVGKWPEGVALAGDIAWVAESGQRQLAKIDLKKGTVLSHANVGRLPVNMVSGLDGSVYALEHTDQRVRVVNAKGVISEFARLPDGPEGMVVDDGALWVLLWEKHSSADSTVVRIDLKTKAQKRSPKLGPNAWQIGVGHDHIWVGHETRISVIDKNTLEKKASIVLSDGLPAEASQFRTDFGRVAVGPKGVYGDLNLGVLRIDPQKMVITHRKRLGQLPLYMVALENVLWVATREGSIFQLDPETLDIRAEHKASAPIKVHDLKVRDGLLYVTEAPRPNSTDPKDESGSLRVFRPDMTEPAAK
jgi:DNA-binding beta-propeller fold protein YncE